MRKKLVFLIIVFLFSQLMLPSKAHAYDLTIYKTADNSVMGVKEDKLGLDMTGYMFLGEGTKEGLYFRIGIQTPFDTILGYLTILEKGFSTEENTNSGNELENEALQETIGNGADIVLPDTIPSITDDNTPSFDEGMFIPDLDNSSSSIIENVTPPLNNTILTPDSDNSSSIIEEVIPSFDDTTFTPIEDNSTIDDIDNSVFDDSTTGNNNTEKEEISVGDSDSALDSTTATVVKGSTKKNSLNMDWRLLFTFGPAKRIFMGESAFVYLGYGFSGDLGHKVDIEKETKHTITESYAIFGADLDFGMRYTLKKNTSIRVGAHFTTSIFGIKGKTITNTNEVILTNSVDIYGYALSTKGIFETLTAKGYIMLATALGEKRNVTYNYSNTTNKIGGGTITVI
ncbi:MAG: hypothetical protein MSS69_05155 [Spirochaetales bacterium]|nr:hypothetical protein [Spirochaetales bacterium]